MIQMAAAFFFLELRQMLMGGNDVHAVASAFIQTIGKIQGSYILDLVCNQEQRPSLTRGDFQTFIEEVIQY